MKNPVKKMRIAIPPARDQASLLPQRGPECISNVYSASTPNWSDCGHAAVDVFTCGDLIDPRVAAKYLIEKFESKNPSIVEMRRGVLGHEKLPHKVTVPVPQESVYA